MKKTVKRFFATLLALIMLLGVVNVTAFADEMEDTVPVVTVQLTPGKTTDGSASIIVSGGELVRVVNATTSKIETVINDSYGTLTAPQSALKFDRNSTADQAAQKKIRELYTDTGHFADTSAITVTDVPASHPFKYVGNGDYSGHYISHIRVIYARDESGNALRDENGNYVIKELQHASSGTPLHYGAELTTNIDGPYHYATGTRPQQFLLMDENGQTFYAYCIDLDTGADEGKWYTLANLEDNDYYASEEAENHVRGIVFNGYWGTESGTGSLASLKAALKAAVAGGSVEDDYNIKQVNRKKFATGYELQEGEYHYGTYVYWDLPPVDVKLTDEVIDAMTEGEALDAMQAAIWSWANGSQATLDGIDGVIVGDLSAASSAMSDSLNGKNDPEGAARTRALYAYLMQQTASAGSVIINDTTFAKEMSLTLGEEIAAYVYKAALNFKADFPIGEADELIVALSYVDAYGEIQTMEKPLTGEDAMVADANGFYTIDGLNLKAGQEFEFDLNIYGKQYLEKNAYIFAAQGGIGNSQTMVSMAEGWHNVDVTKSVKYSLSIKENFVPKQPTSPEDKPENPAADKTSTLIDREENRYEIEVRVPGVDGDNRHDEVIIMVDGSTSVDSEWPAMSSAVKQIGADFLNGSGNTQLTLMAFGISPTVVKAHITSYAELEALLDQYQGNLLYGRSGTNCSAAFDGIREYISEHDNTLNEAYVIYISDGRVNLNNAPYVWKDRISGEVDAVIEEILGVYDSAEPSNAYMTVFGDKAEELKLLAKGFFDNYADKTVRNTFIAQMVPIVTEMTEDGTVTKAKRWASIVFEDVFAAMGLDENTAYPMHVVEKAFVDYKYETNTNCQEAFYCTAGSLKDNYNHTANGQARAISAGQAAAAVAEEIFLVRYNGNYKSVWMENLDRDNVTLVDAGSVANVSAAIKESVAEYIKTPFNDVVVTDYMSKWVNLDAATLQIVDNATGEAIWTAADGWLIDEGRPTAQEVPVVVELVDPADYEAGGADVVGNTSGNIYKLTWYVKDGAMLRADTYSLKYEVSVDTEETGIESDVEYPANGNTEMQYKDEQGEDQTIQIEVPTVNYIEEELEDIEDPEVPLGPTPGGNENIEDEDVPKADVPKTGSMMMLAAMGVMAASGAATVFFRKKKDEE